MDPRPVEEPRIVVGPLLRYVGTTTATVWVETDAPAVVEVLGHEARTFHVLGHHYALVADRGSRAGLDHAVRGAARRARRSGRRRTDARRRRSTRARASGRPGSSSAPAGSVRRESPPYTLAPSEHPKGLGVDALWAYSRRLQAGSRGVAGRAAAAGRPGVRRRGVAGDGRVHPRAPRHRRAAGRGDRRLRGVHAALPRVVVRSRHPLAARRRCRRR